MTWRHGTIGRLAMGAMCLVGLSSCSRYDSTSTDETSAPTVRSSVSDSVPTVPATTIDDAVMHVDPATGAVLSTTEVSGPIDVAVEDDAMWVVASADTVRLDPSTGAIDLTVPVGGGTTGAVALTDDTVWTATPRP